ncbi:MAG: hypothetical protein ACREDJ_07520 [Methylocella sp.]
MAADPAAPIMTATAVPAPIIAATAVPAPIIAATIIAAPIIAGPIIAIPIAISAEWEHAGESIRIVLNMLNRQAASIKDLIDFRNSGDSAGRHGRRGTAKEA